MNRRGVLQTGELVVLIDRRGRRYLKRLRPGHRLTVRSSVLAADELVGQTEGVRCGDPRGESFLVFRPSYADLASLISRRAEPIFAKDAGTILVRAGIGAGARVIEAGVGAGTFTIALLGAVGSDGLVASYERREDFAKSARTAVQSVLGNVPQWKLVVRDVAAGFDERDVDAVVADIPEPTRLLGGAAKALRPGGALACYLPTVLQVRELCDALEGIETFALVEAMEVFERGWHIAKRSVRPEQRMVGHTGFLVFGRRTAVAAD